MKLVIATSEKKNGTISDYYIIDIKGLIKRSKEQLLKEYKKGEYFTALPVETTIGITPCICYKKSSEINKTKNNYFRTDSNEITEDNIGTLPNL